MTTSSTTLVIDVPVMIGDQERFCRVRFAYRYLYPTRQASDERAEGEFEVLTADIIGYVSVTEKRVREVNHGPAPEWMIDAILDDYDRNGRTTDEVAAALMYEAALQSSRAI
jgi:hypothetical protein